MWFSWFCFAAVFSLVDSSANILQHPQWFKNLLQKLNIIASSREEEGPPILDISGTIRGEPSKDEIEAIGKACRDYGFFSIINHGISESILEKFDQAMRQFFALPEEVKLGLARTNDNSRGYSNNEFTKQTRDVKEIFDYGHMLREDLAPNANENRVLDGFNQLPREDDLPGFATVIKEYYKACSELSLKLIRTIALSLGLSADALDDFFLNNHTSFLRLNKYPAIDNDAEPYLNNEANLDQEIDPTARNDDFSTPLNKLRGKRLGVNRHFDAGGLTILRQDANISALQMNLHRPEQKPKWIDVSPIPGALTVNCGDMLQVLSNDVIKAPEHRVKATTHPGKVRYSAPFFLNPAYDANIQPILPENTTSTARYRPFTWGFFRRRRFEGDFQNEGIPEIQIAHFRI